MRCPFCKENVVGKKEVVIMVGEGPAHQECYERHTYHRRQFGYLDLQTLEDCKLQELKDMVLMEINSRQSYEYEIELFA